MDIKSLTKSSTFNSFTTGSSHKIGAWFATLSQRTRKASKSITLGKYLHFLTNSLAKGPLLLKCYFFEILDSYSLSPVHHRNLEDWVFLIFLLIRGLVKYRQ